MKPSRPPARRRHGHEDDDDDDYIPQAPERDQKLRRIQGASPKFVSDTGAGAKADIQDIDTVAKKPAALTHASSPGATTVASMAQPDDMEPEDKATATGSLAAYLHASSAMKRSSTGVAPLASTSVAHSNNMARASNTDRLAKSTMEEQSGDATEVGAMCVRGLSPHDSYESVSTSSKSGNEDSFNDPPQAMYEEKPIQATLVADKQEPDLEAQAEDIAKRVHERMLQNAATGVVIAPSKVEPTSSTANRKKKICILLVAALVIAGAIGAGVGVPLSKESPTTPPIEQCSFCFDESTPGNLDSYEIYENMTCAEYRDGQIQLEASDPDCAFGQAMAWLSCGCPTVPPAPENATCTLCKDGASPLDSSLVTCDDLDTFVSHVGSDPRFSCDERVAWALEQGCACPGNETSPPDNTTELFRNVLIPISGEESLDDETSPQFKALNWIANDDPAGTSVVSTDIEIIEQRYVAAVLYFALGGENWTNPNNFLSGDEICLWNTNQFSGIICRQSTGSVVALLLSDNGLVGTIPEEISYFSGLGVIEMSDGAITGKLPSTLDELNLLSELDLANNGLTGTIPDFIYTQAQLTKVALNFNSFTGTIHTSLGDSPRLEEFKVFDNKLAGPIPLAVGQSSVLTYVELGSNSLTGTIPEFSNVSKMQFMFFGGNNLVGTIPSSIGQLSSLQRFSADNNGLDGTIPDLSGNSLLQELRLQANGLTGDISKVFSLTPPANLALVYIDANAISGTIPSTIGLYTALTELYLHNNKIKGSIPTEVGLLAALSESILLHENQLTGSIPSEIGLLTNLKSNLQLYDNNFAGTLPTTLGLLVSLQHMFFYDNAFVGPIPTELAQCQNLATLSLGNNQLTGDIGPIINSLPRSVEYVELDSNFLTGAIPPSIGTFPYLTYLDLSRNNLNGTIPNEIGLLSNLTMLGLSSNQLTGTVPASIADLPLTHLVLSDNNLTGSLDAICSKGIDFELFAASTCDVVEIECTCCTHCCDPLNCEPIP